MAIREGRGKATGGFLSAQADRFTGAKREEESACYARNDGAVDCTGELVTLQRTVRSGCATRDESGEAKLGFGKRVLIEVEFSSLVFHRCFGGLLPNLDSHRRQKYGL